MRLSDSIDSSAGSFHAAHAELLRDVLGEIQADPDAVGILLQGSVARGDAYPKSDLDLFVLLRNGCRRAFHSETRDGILVEHHFSDWERTTAKLRANPMLTYGFRDGRILRDDTEELAHLCDLAREILASYRTLRDERDGILYWLASARVKIEAAHEAGDMLKAAFVSTTTSWKILEGLWAFNDLPMPPSGAILSRRKDLKQVPNDWDTLFEQLFLGEAPERIAAALTVIDWLIGQV